MIYVGTYTEAMPHVRGVADGIVVAPYSDGVIGEAHTVPVRSPSWLVASATHVYAVVEAGGGDEGSVAVLARGDDSLELVQTVPSGGLEPAHLALDPTGRFLVVANYADGVVSVFELTPDGLVAGLVDRVQHEGSSVDPVRQSGAHPHQVLFDPFSGQLLVVDLGLDAVIAYDLSTGGRLTELRRMPLPAGSGPRHAVVHPDGQHLLVLCELSSAIAVFRAGDLVSVVSTLPEPDSGSFASALAITAAGDRVYASNRGHDSVVVFAWSGSALEPLQFEPTRGRTPRAFTLSPDERWLHVGNQDSDTVVTFARDGHGLLRFRDSVPVPTPVCLLVAPAR